ncbi:mediator complex subunit Med7 [Schizosaccharomyces cryophilus OY26]|uniref:Mediator of RNA polymerase II transcription subunit 7 n=1 Tax=Schizosaccharomyces cryophilus (strain OY26 / ATCC MYA-4695 / CBS 11777 / NBRC 106824 / NRRL Y48691) TaxID=653667 RepID=S9VWQ9_SCHCR|nr:mediator complex subunit Med7 [Schizosaccharomyces cryophilus OY26]EPY50380.1 mediator complex subunit Med7 [Schizosaccharomyces cryophilus OY26]
MQGPEGTQLFSAFPPPPLYYKLFTKENLERVKQRFIRKDGNEAAEGEDGTLEEDKKLAEVFKVPACPTSGTYMMFGDTWRLENVIPSLQDFGITQLYKGLQDEEDKIETVEYDPKSGIVYGYGHAGLHQFDDGTSQFKDVDTSQPNEGENSLEGQEMNEDQGTVIKTADGSEPSAVENKDESITKSIPSARSDGNSIIPRRAYELQLLSTSLMLNFLELLGIMGKAPEQFPQKVENIRVILLNMHHLINEYRPHQARESLLMLLEKQLAHEDSQTRSLKEHNDQIEQALRKLQSLDLDEERKKEFIESVVSSTCHNNHDSTNKDTYGVNTSTEAAEVNTTKNAKIEASLRDLESILES